MSILETLYDGKYIPPEQTQHLPTALQRKRLDILDQIQAAMGADFLEKNWDTICEAQRVESFANFREGFRLGALFMLELVDRGL